MQEHHRHYQFVRSYQGQGSVYLRSRRHFECDFECGKTEGGDIIVGLRTSDPSVLPLINDLESFVFVSGTTLTKQHIKAEIMAPGPAHLVSDSNGFSCFLTFYAADLTVGNVLTTPLQALKFYLVSFEFVRPLKLHFRGYDIVVSKVDGYQDAENEMEATKRPKMTAEMTITSPNGRIDNEYEVERIAHDLCALFSLAKGCKIEWLYWDSYAADGLLVKSYLWNGKISPYSNWRIILEKPSQDINDYVQQTFEPYRAVNEKGIWKFDQAIDHYTDTVSRASFLELRAINLVVLVDYLTKRYAKHIDLRGSFKARLTILLKDINLKVDNREVEFFVEMRNKLVHEAGFLEREDFRDMKLLYQSQTRQFLKIISLTSRIMLAILQYSGYYHDWQKFEKPEWAGAETARVKMQYTCLNKQDEVTARQ